MRRTLRQVARLDGIVEARRIAATLGVQVRTRRRQLGLTQVEVGRRVGLAQSRMSNIERGLGIGLPLEIWVAPIVRVAPLARLIEAILHS